MHLAGRLRIADFSVLLHIATGECTFSGSTEITLALTLDMYGIICGGKGESK